MPARALHGKHRPSRDQGADRAVITVVLLAVTTVLLLIGFAGPSVYFVRPGPAGWLYIGVVIIAASSALAWLFYFDGKRKKRNPSGLRALTRKSKRPA
jgi:flagellar basal body-associated protein FliL